MNCLASSSWCGVGWAIFISISSLLLILICVFSYVFISFVSSRLCGQKINREELNDREDAKKQRKEEERWVSWGC